MSLVGCSGEEFEGILRSLGFRMQKKKIKRPAAPPAPIMEAVVPPAETEAISEPLVAAEPELVEVASKPEIAAPAAETPPTVEEPVSPPPEPVLEEVEIEVWWPKDTGPFRHRPEAKPKPQPRPVDQKERPQRPNRKHHANERPERREEPTRRPEKPMDPNSPFAILETLKAQMMGKKN
jgi:ATP-dependent RNA helicase SUPV3L1/SUV3